MAHFAKVNEQNNLVETVIVVSDEFENDGQNYINNTLNKPGKWVQTSYNTINNTHKLGNTPLRGNYASIGYSYDEEKDIFLPPKPFNSWTLNEAKADWEAPIAYPDDGQFYAWNEVLQTWDLITYPNVPDPGAS